MEKAEFYELVQLYFNKINIQINDYQKEQLFNYMNMLIEWNEKINLTSIVEPKDIIIKHFVDSASICKYIEDSSKVIDVGTGAGFPGIVLKIMNPTIQITLLDSLNKRMKFLEEAKNKLNLENVEIVCARCEDVARNLKYREMYDVAVSRAVAKLSVLMEYLSPFVKKDKYAICMKGANADEEIDNAKVALKTLKTKIIKIDKQILPNTDYSRNIIILKKYDQTPKKFPRKAGIPSKKPLE